MAVAAAGACACGDCDACRAAFIATLKGRGAWDADTANLSTYEIKRKVKIGTNEAFMLSLNLEKPTTPAKN